MVVTSKTMLNLTNKHSIPAILEKRCLTNPEGVILELFYEEIYVFHRVNDQKIIYHSLFIILFIEKGGQHETEKYQDVWIYCNLQDREELKKSIDLTLLNGIRSVLINGNSPSDDQWLFCNKQRYLVYIRTWL